MKPIKIFVEGIADKKFIIDYLKFLGLEVHIADGSVVNMDGKDNILLMKNEFQKNSDNDGVNLVIVDADDDFQCRKAELEKIKTDKNLEFEYFVIPNNSVAGALEDLLENTIPEENKIIFEKWQKFEESLKEITLRGNPLTIPSKKTKIYAYLEVLLGKSRKEKDLIKERSRNYLNEKHWDLHKEFLTPLKIFLQKNFENAGTPE